jgi:hypothetical protein
MLENTFTGCTAALVFVALLAGLALPSDGAAERFVGGCATAAALAYYAAPLSSAWDVVRTRCAARREAEKPRVRACSTARSRADFLCVTLRCRNAASLSLPLCCASLLNAALWSVYGAAVRDAAILTPNVPGIACGLLQLALIARYGTKAAAAASAAGAKDAPATAGLLGGAAGGGVGAAPDGYDRLDEEGGGMSGGRECERDIAPAGLTGRSGSGAGERTLSPRRPSSGRD